jgi:hypothetical protein
VLPLSTPTTSGLWADGVSIAVVATGVCAFASGLVDLNRRIARRTTSDIDALTLSAYGAIGIVALSVVVMMAGGPGIPAAQGVFLIVSAWGLVRAITRLPRLWHWLTTAPDRDLSRRAAFAAVTIVTIAVGIGAATSIYSVADGVLFRPLPFPDPDRLDISRGNANRPTWQPASMILKVLLITLSCFHYYTAGFGLLRETTHRGVHLAFVLGLIFVVFGFRRAHDDHKPPRSWLAPGGVPLFDWLLGIAVALSVLYIPYIFDDMAFRVGNPSTLDVVMGSILLVLLLEATRRSMGWPLPLIAIVFMVYALAGPIFPGLLQHAGASWKQLVNHQYLTSQGVYGIAVGVVATYVFHFVLFGVLATRVGLGQLFLDIASSIAGRYAGGPAKVSVCGSAMFGMLSGSSVANAVTVGSLTIPAMIRVGYKREFAGAVEAASSTGGQITPPVLGAAA